MQEICYCTQYREDQLYITPEIKVFHMLLERCHTENREGSIKRHIQYFNFRSKIQLDHHVPLDMSGCVAMLFIFSSSQYFAPRIENGTTYGVTNLLTALRFSIADTLMTA